ncbi:MAG: voltage-gated potassium channel [Myxococcota bacterium]
MLATKPAADTRNLLLASRFVEFISAYREQMDTIPPAMKFLPSELAYILSENESKQNLKALASYLAFLFFTIIAFSVAFHMIMVYEDQEHSWITGLYWTLTVMSTLGFGDITFHSDLGRAFTIIVLVSGIVMLLVVLPFTFIRFFYAPWLEAQIRLRAPRKVKADTKDHVIICDYDEVAKALILRFDELGIQYFVIEADATRAATLHGEGISVVTGPPTHESTYISMKADRARMVVANKTDAANTNITLTVRAHAPSVPVVALASSFDSVDLLQLSGATHVIPVKHQLGEHLASRVNVGTRKSHRIGNFEDLVIAEFPINGTKMPGQTIRDSRLRELTGLSIVAVWEGGEVIAATPDTVLNEHSVPILVGTEEQVNDLDSMFMIYHPNDNPVLVIGGGTVGCAAATALKHRDAPVTILEVNPALEDSLRQITESVCIGDAANLQTIMSAGLADAPSVLLTTNDDATNIYLTVYCRKLNPDAHIVSRITDEFNLAAIHRAGADFSLSHVALAAKSILSLVVNRELVIIGEETELFVEPVPASMAGKTLAESGIGATYGLNVIAVSRDGVSNTSLPPSTELPRDATLAMIGTSEQHRHFLSKA